MKEFTFFEKMPIEILNEDGSLILYENFFPTIQVEDLINSITWQQDHIRIFGRVHPLPRLTAFYGNQNICYEYSGIKMSATPWSSLLNNIKNEIESVTKNTFNCVLLNYYRNGYDHMSYHADDEKELGINPTIASVSFGATRKFTLKHRYLNKKIQINLLDKSLLIMQGELQHNWLHKINKTILLNEPRINLTFRMIKKFS